MGIQAQKEAYNSCSSLRNKAAPLSQLTRCYGWHVPLPASGWTTGGRCQTKRGWGLGGCSVNLGCWKTAFLKAQTHAQFLLLLLSCSPYKGRRGRMPGYPTPLGAWQSSQRKTTFLFLELMLPGWGHRGKIRKRDGQVKRGRTRERKILRHRPEAGRTLPP